MELQARIDELKATGELPSPGGVALALLRLGQEECRSTKDIVQVIRPDPALTGRVIKHANSTVYATYQKVATINDAVKRLGIRAVSQLALGFSLLANHREGRCEAFDYQGYWARSFITAVASRIIAHHRGLSFYEEMFTCGLLNQIGWLGLASVHPEKYAEVLRSLPDGKLSTLLRMERQEFGIDHSYLSAALMEDWGIPSKFVQAVRCHKHDAKGGANRDDDSVAVARVLSLARVMGQVCMADESERSRVAPDVFSLAELHGIEREPLIQLYSAIMEEWREWAEVLDVAPPEFQTLSVSAEKDKGTTIDDQLDLVAPGTDGKSADPGSSGKIRDGDLASDGLRILVLDDDPVQQRVIAHHLRKVGHQVRQAMDGRSGLEMIVKDLPQLIVSDWMMPKLDGIKLCRSIRQAQSTNHIYLIMLTSRDDEESIVQAFEAGVDDYIVKPFNPRTLMARIRAGQRIVRLKEQVEKDRGALRDYAARLSILNRKLEEAALTDSLTKLPNRRYAMKLLREIWSRPDAKNPLSCMVIDIDRFKDVNDSLGHDVGDIVLRDTAAVLKNSLREDDIVCRFGGEEFIVISEGTGLAGSLQLAERLRSIVEKHQVNHEGGMARVTVSIGVAERGPGRDDIRALIKDADRQLYRAKDLGRNRVCPELPAEDEQALEDPYSVPPRKVAV